MGNCVLEKHTVSNDHIRLLKPCAQMSDEEINKSREVFKAKYPKGYMSKKQFTEELTVLRQGRPADKNLVDRIFQAFDRDASDTISFNEFMAGVVAVYGPDVDKKLEFFFDVFDKDEDKLISRREVEKVMRILLVGRVNEPDEVEQYVNTIFMYVDKDKDDYISLKEFMDGCKSNETIFNIMNPFTN